MAIADDLNVLINRINRELDDWSNFYEHLRTVWSSFRFWVDAGNALAMTNVATGHTYTENDLVNLTQYYMTENLAPFVLQRFSSTFEELSSISFAFC